MAVKATTQQAETKVKDFPKLMISILKENKCIVFFEKKGKGWVVWSADDKYTVGYSSNIWIMENFTDYNEPITLQNEE